MRTTATIANAMRIATRNLRANKLRSFLTVLGVVIGVAAVIAMVALGHGTQERVLEEFQAMGTDLLIVFPGVKRHGGVSKILEKLLTLDDARAIQRQCPSVGMVAPELGKNTQVRYYERNMSCTVLGTTPDYRQVRSVELGAGRFFTAEEDRQVARVCVLGSEVARRLFRGAPALGERIRIRGGPYKVVGVAEEKGRQGMISFDEQVLVPFNTFRRRIQNKPFLRLIAVKSATPAVVLDAMKEIEGLMAQLHPPLPGEEPQVAVFSFTEILGRVQSTITAFTFLVASIAAISLLVGGIGIMNIMLVSVTERTREIGVRKALGATRRDILVQFLAEAVAVGVVGGLAGVGLGAGGTWLATVLGNLNASITFWSVAVSLGVAGGTGVVFGVYPAWKAAGLDPIEALRWE